MADAPGDGYVYFVGMTRERSLYKGIEYEPPGSSWTSLASTIRGVWEEPCEDGNAYRVPVGHWPESFPESREFPKQENSQIQETIRMDVENWSKWTAEERMAYNKEAIIAGDSDYVLQLSESGTWLVLPHGPRSVLDRPTKVFVPETVRSPCGEITAAWSSISEFWLRRDGVQLKIDQNTYELLKKAWIGR